MSRTPMILVCSLVAVACAPSLESYCHDPELTVCEGSCVDLTTDLDNCGSCGTVCESVCLDGGCAPFDCLDALDLVIVIDDSRSMMEELATLRDEVRGLVGRLTGVGGEVVFNSVHIGIISSDLGALPSVPSCEAPVGRDGALLTSGVTDCAAPPAGIFSFDAPGSAAGYDALACVMSPTIGCGIPQILDAALKAVSPARATSWTKPGYTPPTFVSGSMGRAGPGGSNDGLVRSDSVLAVLLVTDEDDCSTTDPSIFEPTAPGALTLRCHDRADRLQSITRFVEGLAALRSVSQSLVVGAVAGVPERAIASPYEEVLEMPEMQETVDPVTRLSLLPACDSSHGVARPARRVVESLAGLRDVGAITSLSSICADGGYLASFEAALVAASHPGACRAAP